MRSVFSFYIVLVSFSSFAQTNNFPQSWVGNWKGELQWFRNGKELPQRVNMELRIQPLSTNGEFSWHIIYGKETEDSRPYTLRPKDSTGIHWAIDEKNSIVLDQFWIGNKFCGAFTVLNSTILNSYWIENDKLIAEFYTIGSKPFNTTGKGTDEIPLVDSYKANSYQKAILSKVK